MFKNPQNVNINRRMVWIVRKCGLYSVLKSSKNNCKNNTNCFLGILMIIAIEVQLRVAGYNIHKLTQHNVCAACWVLIKQQHVIKWMRARFNRSVKCAVYKQHTRTKTVGRPTQFRFWNHAAKIVVLGTTRQLIAKINKKNLYKMWHTKKS